MIENHINKKGLKRLEKDILDGGNIKKLQAFFVVFGCGESFEYVGLYKCTESHFVLLFLIGQEIESLSVAVSLDVDGKGAYVVVCRFLEVFYHEHLLALSIHRYDVHLLHST